MKTTHCKSSQSLNGFDPVQKDTMKTIACLAAHTHIGQIRECPPPRPSQIFQFLCFTTRRKLTRLRQKDMKILSLNFKLMHQSIPAVPLSVPRAEHLPTPSLFPSLWHAPGFLSEYNYTEDFTGKSSIIFRLICQGQEKNEYNYSTQGFHWKIKHNWLICQGQEKNEEGCKGMFLI